MRLAPLLSATALALVAASALAQGAAQPAGNGLGDLSATLNGLSDNARAEAPAQPVETPAPPPPPAPAPPPARPRIAMPPEPLSRAQVAELQAAATRGRLLGTIERAGRAGTADMLSRVPDPGAAGISGWIAEAEGNGVAVTFYADSDAGPVLVYRVVFNGGRAVSRDVHLSGARPALNPLQARMATARAVAERQAHRPCAGDAFNYFVVPPLTPDGPVDVYQISPQTQRGVYPLGGHFRTSVAPDGSVVATRSYTASCVNATVTAPAAGARPAPIGVTHLMDPLPQDLHVFLAAWTGHPLLVVSDDPQRLFAVTPDGIAEVPRGTGR